MVDLCCVILVLVETPMHDLIHKKNASTQSARHLRRCEIKGIGQTFMVSAGALKSPKCKNCKCLH